MRGTRRLMASIVASVCFTALSSVFNFYAMRRGILVVGDRRRSLLHDLRCMPRPVLDFILFVPRRIPSAFAAKPAPSGKSPASGRCGVP